jgi:tRNA(adenine34) deaminase
LGNNDEYWMKQALMMAEKARDESEVPVGAVVVLEDEMIASAYNRSISLSDPTAHAEILALRAAARKIDNYRLLGVTLYSTLEPCVMCAGALVHARVHRLVYGAHDPRTGACGSVFNVVDNDKLNHRVEVMPGVLGEVSANYLVDFFKNRR